MRLLDLLKRLEWHTVYRWGDPETECPECEGTQWEGHERGGHEPGCELKAAIDHFSKVEAIPFESRTLEDVRWGPKKWPG